MTLNEKAEIAVKAARAGNMSGKIWIKNATEVHVYLRRTNAAQTEAGYIRLWMTPEGKAFAKYVQTASGKGSRTAESEAEAVFARYQDMRKAADEAKKQGSK